MAHGDTMSRKRIRRVVDTSGGAAVPFPGPPVLYAVDWAFARACRRASNLAGAAAGSALEPVALAADGVEHLAAGASVSMRARRGRTAGRGRGRRAAVADKEVSPEPCSYVSFGYRPLAKVGCVTGEGAVCWRVADDLLGIDEGEHGSAVWIHSFEVDLLPCRGVIHQ